SVDSGSSETAILSAAIADLATVAIAASSTAALPIALARGASMTSTLAARAGARRSMIGIAPAFSVPVEPKPATQATNAVSHSTAATVAYRRGFMIAASTGSKLSQIVQPGTRRADCSDHDMDAQ